VGEDFCEGNSGRKRGEAFTRNYLILHFTVKRLKQRGLRDGGGVDNQAKRPEIIK
jgi:hypothetical protein